MWTLSAGDFKELAFGMVLASDDTAARVVPLAWDLSPLPSDIRLPNDFLGFELWGRCLETFSVLTEQLVEPLGQLGPAERDRIASTIRDLSPEPAASDAESDLARDARLDELDVWRDDNARWREPFLSLDGPDLGTVVHKRREHLHVTLDEAAESADVPASLISRLEGATLDLYGDLPLRSLVSLTSSLSLPPSRRLLQLVRAAVANASTGPSYGDAPALARRRRGVRPAAGSERRGEQAAAAYTERLGELLPPWPS